MGTLVYDSALNIRFHDWVLAHLEIVIRDKFRRTESFSLSWMKPEAVGGGKTTIWLDKRIPLVFDYDSGDLPPMSEEWMAIMEDSASADAGLVLLVEPMDVLGSSELSTVFARPQHSS